MPHFFFESQETVIKCYTEIQNEMPEEKMKTVEGSCLQERILLSFVVDVTNLVVLFNYLNRFINFI